MAASYASSPYNTITNYFYSFTENIEALLLFNDVTTHDFLLRARTDTIAPEGLKVNIKGVPCQLFDDGGGRLGPKRWTQRFRNADCLVFAVNLLGYCQTAAGTSCEVSSHLISP